jgi:hypothetical protein
MVRVDRADRRSRRLALSAAGRTTIAHTFPLWERGQRELERRLADLGGLRARLYELAFGGTSLAPLAAGSPGSRARTSRHRGTR